MSAIPVTRVSSEVIKTLLAITHAPDRRAEPYNIIAELHAAKYLDVARMVDRDEVEIVLAGDLIARIMTTLSSVVA